MDLCYDELAKTKTQQGNHGTNKAYHRTGLQSYTFHVGGTASIAKSLQWNKPLQKDY